jgi:5-methylcytosine-specific restriction enzyme subunit McrC
MGSARFVLYEHQRLVVGEAYDTRRGPAVFTEAHFEALARYQERTGTAALRLGHRSVRLAQHVGYLRVGPVTLEVYPKLGPHRPDEDWRSLLLHMLRVVAGVRLTTHDHAPLHSRAGDLYEVLVGRFLDQVHALLREGLARSYREVEENSPAFRGRLLVGPHVRANAAHQERVFVAYEVHDADHLANRILWRALERVRRTTSSSDLLHRAEAAVVDFPEVTDVPIRPSDWGRLHFDRRTARYREAIGLARMILRDERPDLRWGDREVVALLFDMNALFEAYLEQAMRGLPGVHVRSQVRKRFWQPEGESARLLKPDLVLRVDGEDRPIVVDAKWKALPQGRPADDDLRQVFAYLHAFDSSRGVLVYPRAHADQREREARFLGGELSGRVAFVDLFCWGRPDVHAVRQQLEASLANPIGSGHRSVPSTDANQRATGSARWTGPNG